MKMKLMAPLGATLDACPSPRISAMHPSVTHSLTFLLPYPFPQPKSNMSGSRKAEEILLIKFKIAPISTTESFPLNGTLIRC